MDREQLKGQQTPGRWVVITSWNDYMITAEGQNEDAIIWQDGAYDTPTMTEADATLIAEAGTVANRTGMWPEDMEARIKELEEALRPFAHDDLCKTLGGNVHGDDSPLWARDKAMLKLGHFKAARAILNKQ